MPWLMKAEPDTRLERGIDVKFSIDDLQAIGVSKWDGVRNHQAKNLMKVQMKLGDQVLFYHSNCKEPGVYGLATVDKEGYPDFTSWDSTHPYYDPKSVSTSPTWFMVDVRYASHLAHPVLLSLFKYLAGCETLPEEVDYIGEKGLKAIKEMVLVRAGRLSVQPATPEAYTAVLLLGERGGWESLIPSKKKRVAKPKLEVEAGAEGEVGSSSSRAPAEVKSGKKGRKVKEAITQDIVKDENESVKQEADTIGQAESGGRRSARTALTDNKKSINPMASPAQPKRGSKRKAAQPSAQDEDAVGNASARSSKRSKIGKGVVSTRPKATPSPDSEEESELSSAPDE